jgi:hypothetical protein
MVSNTSVPNKKWAVSNELEKQHLKKYHKKFGVVLLR